MKRGGIAEPHFETHMLEINRIYNMDCIAGMKLINAVWMKQDRFRCFQGKAWADESKAREPA